jgi:hypothetical protein
LIYISKLDFLIIKSRIQVIRGSTRRHRKTYPLFSQVITMPFIQAHTMNLIPRIINRIRTDIIKALYRRSIHQILQTPPLKPGNLPFIALSMVHQRDVLSYLVAIKSFAMHTHPARVVIVCDPTIGDQEKAIFKTHIPHAELREATDFQDPRIPKGGAWERLSAITQYSPEAYVVQLDADTVTTAAIPEIVAAITRQQGFVIRDNPDQGIEPLAQTAQRARHWPSVHVQAIAEQVMVDAGVKGRFYIRGCSGFTGFASDKMLGEEFFDFAVKMHKKIGDVWTTWSSEQVTSNYLVANQTNTIPLPPNKYASAKHMTSEAAFIHFIGSERYKNRSYEKTSLAVIPKLNA